MKKVLLLTMAALSILFTQCKKTEVAPSTPSAQGGVNITLNVGGSKVGVNPETGAVTFENGDKIYVAKGGKYVGTLTYNGTQFEGTIQNVTSTEEPLYFYFLGNKAPSESLNPGTTSSLTVDISDQTVELPVISCAPSKENYKPSTFSYTATLHNQCALVKFTLDQTVTGYVAVKDMNNVVAVDLTGAGTFTPSMGNVVTKTNKIDNTHCYMIALPNNAAMDNLDLFCEDGKYGSSNLSAVVAGSFQSKDVALQQGPVFTVASGKTVTFSPGLMYWDGSTGQEKFKFEEDQRDFQSAWNTNHVSHFYWSKTASVAYAGGYSDAWASKSDVFFTNSQSDWAKPNSGFTVNGETGIWRTLTNAEWVYLLNVEKATSGARTQINRFAKARIGGKPGLLIFPDGYNNGVEVIIYGVSQVDTKAATYPDAEESIDSDVWTAMQSAGVVFLPTAGNRSGGNVYNVGSYGDYWTSSPNALSASDAFCMDFISNDVYSPGNGYRNIGRCVRLVR